MPGTEEAQRCLTGISWRRWNVLCVFTDKHDLLLFSNEEGTVWGKSRFTAVYVENSAILNNNTRVNSVLLIFTTVILL